VIVSDDLQRLGGLLNLPPGVTGAKWALGPVGAQGGPPLGPQDTRVVALLRFEPPGDPFEPSDGAGAVAVPLEYARAVLPARVVATLPVVGGDVVLAGPFRDAGALTRMPHRVKFAAAIADGLLVHALSY
jgi:hypothetical protein